MDRGSGQRWLHSYQNDFYLATRFLFSVEWISLATAVEENRAGFALFGGRLIMIGAKFFKTLFFVNLLA